MVCSAWSCESCQCVCDASAWGLTPCSLQCLQLKRKDGLPDYLTAWPPGLTLPEDFQAKVIEAKMVMVQLNCLHDERRTIHFPSTWQPGP